MTGSGNRMPVSLGPPDATITCSLERTWSTLGGDMGDPPLIPRQIAAEARWPGPVVGPTCPQYVAPQRSAKNIIAYYIPPAERKDEIKPIGSYTPEPVTKKEWELWRRPLMGGRKPPDYDAIAMFFKELEATEHKEDPEFMEQKREEIGKKIEQIHNAMKKAAQETLLPRDEHGRHFYKTEDTKEKGIF